jgi:hypothetical protein
MLPAELIADAVTRLSNVQWSWSLPDVEALAAQLGWPLDGSPAHSVGYLRTDYPVHGLAIVSIFSEISQGIVVPATDVIEQRFPDRVDAFAQTVRATVAVLGQPAGHQPGHYPEVWWPGSGGRVGVEDNGTYIGLELLSARYASELDADGERSLKKRQFRALNPDLGEDDDDSIFSGYPEF